MKKEYKAPDLYFESFELSGSIAAGCDTTGITIVNTIQQAYPDLFTDTGSCKDTNYSTILEGLCYTSGTSMTIFQS